MYRSGWALVAVGCLLIAGGCRATKPYWRPATFLPPVSQEEAAADTTSALGPAEAAYADAFALEEQESSDCVDRYLQCAQLVWPFATGPVSGDQQRAGQLYRASVGKFVETSQQFGRFHPVQGVQVASETGTPTAVPVRFHGFSWQPAEFGQFTVVGDYRPPKELQPHVQDGLGTAMLVQQTSQRPFVHPRPTFSVTAILRPVDQGPASPGPASPGADSQTGGGHTASPFVLDIVNPLTIRQTQIGNASLPLAYDLTAPLAYLSVNRASSWLIGFLSPVNVEAASGLRMLQPYQPGKIPVLFVHGLASDPMTWAAMANELFRDPDLLAKYQFLSFSYPTGTPFPGEAAKLRRYLVEWRNHVDPHRQDPALDQMVLIGHSMGGLVSKMQITSSGDKLVRSIVNVPIEELKLTPEMRASVQEKLFFEPSSQIRRVLFIGTPHRGSSIASSPIGDLASKMVQRPAAVVDSFTQFAEQNADHLATPLMRKLPTSVDLLKPKNTILEAIFQLPVSPRVSMHSIVGAGHPGGLGTEPSDGIVPVSSARHPNVESELIVSAGHDLHHHPETIAEVVRILKMHAANANAGTANESTANESTADASTADAATANAGTAVR